MPWQGVVKAALIGTAFAANSTLAAAACAGGSNPFTVLVLRAGVAFLTLYILLVRRGIPRRLPVPQRWQAIGLGVLFGSYSWAVLQAFAYMPVALVVVIFYTYPLMVAGYAWWRGWERFSPATGLAFLTAFAGIMLALDVFGAHPDPRGVAMVLISAVVVTIVLTLSPRVRGQGDSRPVTLHMLGTACGLYMLGLITSSEFSLPVTMLGWFGLIGAPVFYTWAVIALFEVLAVIGPFRMSLVMNVEPVVSVLLSFLVLGQQLRQLQLVGVALVVAAVVLLEGSRLRRARAQA